MKLKKFSFSKTIGVSKVISFDNLIYLVLLMVILSLILVEITNDSLFHNTKYFESISSQYKVPDYYSFSEMRVEVDKTYYKVKEIVNVFRSIGVRFDKSTGILTKGFVLSDYKNIIMVEVASLLYMFLALVRVYTFSPLSIRQNLKDKGFYGKVYIITWILLVILVLQTVFPLL